jgi:hypothetical protein
MRGKDQQSDSLFSDIRLETRIPADHPLRPIRKLVDEALLELSQWRFTSISGGMFIAPRDAQSDVGRRDLLLRTQNITLGKRARGQLRLGDRDFRELDRATSPVIWRVPLLPITAAGHA